MYLTQKRYYEKNREKLIAHSKQYYRQHKEEILVRSREYKHTHKEEIRAQWERYKPKRSLILKKQRQQIKTEVLTHYGNDKLACVKCGYSDIRALCLDHINGYDKHDKKRIDSLRLYRYLKLQGFPEGFQTLCANCNYIKEFEVDLKRSKYALNQ